MFRLDTEFYRLPLRLDAARLAGEASQFSEAEWRPHPQGHAGNSALPLVTVGGTMNDEVKGPMGPTPFLQRCPYIRQALAALRAPIGRARLMRIAGQADATEHVDTNYYWMHHVRVHIPAVTNPAVRFLCNGREVHMAPGEAWIFDSWKLHNVLNPANASRIHLVVDTVGSARFWELVERSARPFDPDPGMREPRGEAAIPWPSDGEPAIEFEQENFPLVMSPWEQAMLAERMLEHLPAQAQKHSLRLRCRLDRLNQEWHALWTASGAANATRAPLFREAMGRFDAELDSLAGDLMLNNGIALPEALRQAIVRPAENPEVARTSPVPITAPVPPAAAQAPAPSAPAPPIPQFDRPVFIVAAPRSGSSMLFELLSHSPDAWTIGGESHHLFENIPAFHPAAHNWQSNQLTADDARPEALAALHAALVAQLRDHAGQPLRARNQPIRLLEKTPKNSLRIPFLAAAFPGARFICLFREPAENISSILDAWRSGQFVTYPELPGGGAWSLALVPGWRELLGRSPAEIAATQWVATNAQILEDIAAIPREHWCAISYAEVVRDPQSAAQRLCTFAGMRWEQSAPCRYPGILSPRPPRKNGAAMRRSWRRCSNPPAQSPRAPAPLSAIIRPRPPRRKNCPCAPTSPARSHSTASTPPRSRSFSMRSVSPWPNRLINPATSSCSGR